MPTYERLDYGSDDGSQWGGTSTDKLGFYGLTPVTQYTVVGAASTYLTSWASSGAATGSTIGFTDAASMSSFILQLSTMNAAGRRLGFWT